MLTHVIGRFRSNHFVEEHDCTQCEELYPKIVADKLARARENPKRLYREALSIMEDGYARFVMPLVDRLGAIGGHEPRVAELREKISRQLGVPRPLSANANWN